MCLLIYILCVADIVETSVLRGDGLTESMDWLVEQLGSSSHQSKKSFVHGPAVARSRDFSNATNCDTTTDANKDRSPTRDYCNRAYSAFKCFFVRPHVPPDIDD